MIFSSLADKAEHYTLVESKHNKRVLPARSRYKRSARGITRALTPDPSYETQLVDISNWVTFAFSMAVAGLKNEPKNIEYRTAE